MFCIRSWEESVRESLVSNSIIIEPRVTTSVVMGRYVVEARTSEQDWTYFSLPLQWEFIDSNG